jgi:hypothetical protein
MSTDIDLPSLSKWTESHITAIYNADSDTATIEALDNFLSKHAVIIVNGENTSHDDLAKELQSEKIFEIGDFVRFLGVVEVPANNADSVEVIGRYFFI